MRPACEWSTNKTNKHKRKTLYMVVIVDTLRTPVTPKQDRLL